MFNELKWFRYFPPGGGVRFEREVTITGDTQDVSKLPPIMTPSHRALSFGCPCRMIMAILLLLVGGCSPPDDEGYLPISILMIVASMVS